KTLAQIHIVGRQKKFSNRIYLDGKNYFDQALTNLKSSKQIPNYLEDRYESYFQNLKQKFNELITPLETFRVHGDFHYGNILWQDQEPIIFDFDDCLTGP